MPLTNGDTVKVYPRGEPHKAVAAIVAVVSTNQRSIAVAFGDKPPFDIGFNRGNWMLHPEHGVVMLASREDSGGCGCWIELFGQNRFEIEKKAVAGA